MSDYHCVQIDEEQFHQADAMLKAREVKDG